MKDRRIAQASIIISIFSLLIALGTYLLAQKKFNIEYGEEVFVKIDGWPFKKINRNPSQQIDVEITNTSKTNLNYYLRVNGNAVCVQEYKELEPLGGCDYESEIMSLSNPTGEENKKKHQLYMHVGDGAIKMNPLAYSSEPNYYITIEVLSGKNGKKLYSSSCYYSFWTESNTLHFYEPIIDSSGKDKILHARCFGDKEI